MAIPPRRPLRQTGGTPPKPPAARSGLAPAAVPAASRPAPARKPAARRRIVARSSGGGGDRILNTFMIRLIVAVLILLLGGFGSRGLLSSSSPNQRYFDALVEVWNRDDGGADSAQRLRRINALPISGVTDPKLQEVHQILVDLNSLPPPPISDEAGTRILNEINPLDQLQKELNSKYAGR